ncbi:MAG: hypothetical protein MH204_00380 [Fimbriimonadaceae bacterium]|nr:hypothetical protein [Fimbriimonadaceae bacterium]
MKRTIAAAWTSLAAGGAIAAAVIALGLAPAEKVAAKPIGLKQGDIVTPFEPHHLAGPDKGTETCPPCKYGMLPAVQVWARGESDQVLLGIAQRLSSEMTASKKDLRAFMILVADTEAEKAQAKRVAAGMETDLKIKNVALAHLPSNHEAVANYGFPLDGSVKNMAVVYSKLKVTETIPNVLADPIGLDDLSRAVRAAQID